MKSIIRILVVLPIIIFSQPHATASDLTPEMVESLKAKIFAIKNNLTSHLSERNQSAGRVFLEASADPKKAIELYLRCHKEVNYDREERPESDFRDWKESQSDRFKDDQFMESLRIQLRYLGLSCQVAEAEELDTVFPSLMTYVDGLSRLEEMPDGILMQSVAGSIFAEAYYLEKLLGSNDNWEPVPYNIGGIYEKAIFPYLRENKPEALMNAWDKRIEQQTRIAESLEVLKEKELRGMDRDEERRARNNQNRRGGGILQSMDKDDFIRETLPTLQWGKLKDQFSYMDQVGAAQKMLSFIESNLTHPKCEEWFSQFTTLILSTEAAANVSNETAPATPPADTGSQ